MFSDRLIVGLIDGDGQLIASQPYREWEYGERSREILIPIRGRRLLAILQDDIGNISYEDNRMVLKHILYVNSSVSAATLMGKIAEAVVVRRCREDESLNLKLFQLACRKRARMDTVMQYVPIGTGLKQTQLHHSRRYNPSDPQRDIIWVDKNDVPALMRGSTSTKGVEAGLQVKNSVNGLGYIYSDLIHFRYEVPILYFPISNDYEKIVDRLAKDPRAEILDPESGEYRRIRPGEDLIDIRAYDYEAYAEVKDYYPIIQDLISGDLELDDLVDEAWGKPTLENTVLLTALSTNTTRPLVLR